MDEKGRVEVFGTDSRTGSFMDRVRDPRTGEWLEYVGPHDDDWRDAQWRHGPVPADSPRLVLAILDTGVVHEHPSLRGVDIVDHDLTGEGPEDRNGHGTVVTLTAIRGLAPSLQHLLNVKITDGAGQGRQEWLIEGMDWVARWAAEHPDSHVNVNISAGVHRRRWGRVRTCEGSCDVCEAALRLSRAEALVMAAAGNTAGVTACPAAAALAHPESAIMAMALAGYADSGIGTHAMHVDQLPRPRPVSEPEARIEALSGPAAWTTALDTADLLVAQGDLEQAEKVYRHVLRLADDDHDARVRACYSAGRVGWQLGRPDAHNLLQDAIDAGHATVSVSAAHFLAVELLSGPHPDAAMPYLDLVVQAVHRPDLAGSARYNRGMLLRRAGDLHGAQTDLLEVARGTTDSRDRAALALGSLLAGRGRLQEARSWLGIASRSADPHLADLGRRGLTQVESALAHDVRVDDEGP